MATPTYTLLDSRTLSSNVASLDFTSISQDFTDLVLTAVPLASTNGFVYLRPNNESSPYDIVSMEATEGSQASYTTGSWPFISAGANYYNTSSEPRAHEYHIFNYSSTTQYKSYIGKAGGTGAGTGGITMAVGHWQSFQAVTSLRIFADGTLLAGSTFNLYGIES
jgi:hypothetical protein